MKNLLKSEIFKLYKDRQIRFIALFIFFYIITGPVLSIESVRESYKIATSGQILEGFTVDISFEIILISLIASAVFASEYTNKTIKNILIYNNRKDVFISKLAITLIGIFVLLLLWYISGLLFTLFYRKGIVSVQDVLYYFLKFIIHYLVIIGQSGILILISVLIKNRALTNISSVLVWMCTVFIPVYKDKVLLDIIIDRYPWGVAPDLYIIAISFVVFGICSCLGYFLFEFQDLKC